MRSSQRPCNSSGEANVVQFSEESSRNIVDTSSIE